MRKKKLIFAGLLAVAAAAGLAGCSKDTKQAEKTTAEAAAGKENTAKKENGGRGKIRCRRDRFQETGCKRVHDLCTG